MPPFTQLLAVIVTVLAACPVVSEAGDFGTTGLITLPSARMQADGSLTATIARNEVADIYNVTFQATPFIETSFRYSIFNPRDRAVSGRRDIVIEVTRLNYDCCKKALGCLN